MKLVLLAFSVFVGRIKWGRFRVFAPYTDAFKVDEVSTTFARFFMVSTTTIDDLYLPHLYFEHAYFSHTRLGNGQPIRLVVFGKFCWYDCAV